MKAVLRKFPKINFSQQSIYPCTRPCRPISLQDDERRGSPSFLYNRLTDGGEVVSLMLRPHLTPKVSWYLFLLQTVSTPETYCGLKN
jgi:hypothetical protein